MYLCPVLIGESMPNSSLTVVGVAVASFGALLLSAHSVLNAILVRRPPSASGRSFLGARGSASPSDSALPGDSVSEAITVCIPARNEAMGIGVCVASVLANRGVADLRVIVLDDASSDDTRLIVATEARHDARLSLVEGGDVALPEGWIGKTWACERLLALVTTPVVVFVDADVRVGPAALSGGLAMLRRHSFSLVSPYPKQLVGTWAERLTQPLLQWLWMTFLPLRLAERTKPVSLTAANGQFMILDTETLRRIGGFQSVAGEVLDDVALARSLKRSGSRATVAEGSTLATCRMYEGWESLRDGYTKNLWSATGSRAGAAGIIALFLALYLLPIMGMFAAALTGNATLFLVGTGGYLFGVGGRFVTARATGGSLRDAVFHPISIVILVWLIVRSWREHRRGTITWKGRSL
jgi:Glycosyltransferase like family 2